MERVGPRYVWSDFGGGRCGDIFLSTINPPSTNFWIVCRRKDRGGCGVHDGGSLACFGGRPPLGSLDVCWMTGRGFFGTRFLCQNSFADRS